MAAKIGANSEHLVLYHLLIDGHAVVDFEDGVSIALAPGDIVIFPHGHAHDMSSGNGTKRPFPNYGITAKIKSRDLNPLRAGGGGDVSRFVCGYMTCDPYLCRPILDGLPPAFKVNIRTDASGHWIESSIKHLVEESTSGRVGSEAMLAKLWRRCSWIRCGVTSTACPSSNAGGSPAHATRSWDEASGSCTDASRIRGRSRTSPTRSGRRDRCWSNGSPGICPSRR
jgi:hypothetical protein